MHDREIHFRKSYVIIVGLRYLHDHVCSTRFFIVASGLSFYFIISNHPVAGSIIVKSFSISGSPLLSILILYGPIRSTNNLSTGVAFASLVVKRLYFNFFSCS